MEIHCDFLPYIPKKSLCVFLRNSKPLLSTSPKPSLNSIQLMGKIRKFAQQSLIFAVYVSNRDLHIYLQVGDLKKYTSVKESTNCPYYNEVEVHLYRPTSLQILNI